MSRDYTRKEMGYPSEYEMRIPLLRAIGRRGGMIRFSRDGGVIERELADHFGLSKWQREYSDPSRFRSKGGRAWRNHIQFVRKKLIDEGLLVKGIHNLWTLSEAGKRLISDPSLRSNSASGGGGYGVWGVSLLATI